MLSLYAKYMSKHINFMISENVVSRLIKLFSVYFGTGVMNFEYSL
jgi:hypothetical protein